MQKITVETVINAPLEKVWESFTDPKHVMMWNNASPDWHTPKAENDLKVGGKFSYRMESKDGSQGFDFAATYTEVVPQEFIAYTIADGRNVDVTFDVEANLTHVIETFDPENQNPPEFQKAGWQAILDNFKKYVEASK